LASERRKHTRVQATFPCVMLGPDRKHESFDLLDLSESGVRMRCARSLAPMTQIQVALELPAARLGRPKDVKLLTRGVVVWSHKSGKDVTGKGTVPSGYDTGVFFPELTSEQRALLLLYVAGSVA
jgi:hypothetical protein